MTRWYDGPLASFDLETTGVNPFEDVPVSYAICERQGWRLRTRTELVNPGRLIPQGAMDIHKITDEMAANGTPLEQAVEDIVQELIRFSTERIPLIGMNIAYDLTMINGLCRWFGEFSLPEVGWDGPVIDVMVLDRKADKWRKGPRNLAALCAHYEVDSGDAHTAKSDAVSSMKIAVAIAKKYTQIGVKEPLELHRLQVKWSDEQRHDLSDYWVKKGKEPFPDTEYGWPIHNRPAASEDFIADTPGEA